MIRIRTKLATLWLLVFTLSALAEDKPIHLNWISDQSNNPFDNKAQPFDVDGDTAKILIAALPQLKFNPIFANFERTFLLLDTMPEACSSNKVKNTKREQKYLFSQLAQTIFPGQRLYLHKNSPIAVQLQKNNPKRRVSIIRLLKQFPQLMLGVTSGRSYGAKIDNLLKTLPDQLWHRKAAGSAGGLIGMFLAKRFDAMIEYPSVFEFYADKAQGKSASLISFAVEELSSYTLGYIICARSEQGQHFMTMINAAMQRSVQQRAYLDAHLKWFAKDTHQSIVNTYNKVYGTHFSLKQPAE